MVKISSRNDSLDNVYLIGVPLSLLIHIFLLLILNTRNDYSSITTLPRSAEVVFVPREKAQQIVSPTEDSEKELPPKETNQLSDKETVVVREQIKRGSIGSANISRAEKSAPPTSAKIAERSDTPTGNEQPSKELKFLSLDPSKVAQKYSTQKPASETRPTTRPFSRPQGSGAQFLGDGGTSDYLPNLPDGDITLLNAKANQYAVFVRRVAIQVFSLLRQSGWAMMNAGDILSIKDYSSVRAIMSPKGELLKVELLSDSGSKRFDDVVITAAKSGAKDPHPPEGAEATDGNIHFIFQSKSWVAGGVAPKTGAPIERRWLFLATGLE